MRNDKWNKKRAWLIIVALGLVLCGVIGSIKLVMYRGAVLDEEILNEVAINAPNVSLGSRSKVGNGVFKGQFIYKQFKNVDGYIIPWTDIIGNYSIWGVDISGRIPLNNSNGVIDFIEGTNQKMMKFYKQNVSYEKLNQDISQVPVDTNRVAEFAISFDKEYSLKEIQARIPANLNIAWFWLDGQSSEEQVDALMPDQIYGFEGIQKKYEKVSDDEVFEGNYNNFVSSLEGLAPKSDEAAALFAKYSRKPIDQLQFKGLILTGQEKNFKPLAGASFIRASEIGATADIVPYIKPYK